MTPTQSIEITIRAAQIMKAFGSLVGAKDAHIAKMILREAACEVMKMNDFLDQCISAKGKSGDAK